MIKLYHVDLQGPIFWQGKDNGSPCTCWITNELWSSIIYNLKGPFINHCKAPEPTIVCLQSYLLSTKHFFFFPFWRCNHLAFFLKAYMQSISMKFSVSVCIMCEMNSHFTFLNMFLKMSFPHKQLQTYFFKILSSLLYYFSPSHTHASPPSPSFPHLPLSLPLFIPYMLDIVKWARLKLW